MFKITGGTFRGTKLLLPDANTTRPTSTRARESLFNCLFSLDFQMSGAVIIDGFAGSGAIGLECLSHGASFCTFVENDKSVQKILAANINKLKCEARTKVTATFDTIQHKADLIFLDPPYFQKDVDTTAYISALISLKNTMTSGTIIVIETDATESPEIPFLAHIYSKTYGTARLSFYRC